MTRFKQDPAAQKALSQTVKLADMKSEDYDTVFYVGGHGPMWDLAESPDSIALLESFYNSGKPIALVCHSPGVLRHVTYQGAPLVKGKRVTGFTNGEEEGCVHRFARSTCRPGEHQGADGAASTNRGMSKIGSDTTSAKSRARPAHKAMLNFGTLKMGDVRTQSWRTCFESL
jgi:putative intracellular protease/amidase